MNAANRSTTRRKHMEEKKKPAHEVKLGRIRVAIWANKSNGKGVWFNTTIVRLYKDGEAWKETNTYGRDDLPIVAKALDMAYGWIWLQATAQSDESNE
jgi:hypothetical protein